MPGRALRKASTERGRSAPAGWFRRLLLGGAIALTAGATLAYGAVHDEFWSLAAVGAAALLASWPFSLRSPRGPRWSASGRVALGAGVALLVLAGLQLVPWPRRVLAAVSPETVRVREAAGESLPGGDAPLELLPSLSPARTRAAACRLATCLVLALVVATSVRSRREFLAVAGLLVVAAAGVATYGLRETLTGSEEIWGHAKVHYRGDVTGTYVNRNHFAGLVALVLPLSLALVVLRPRDGTPAGLSWRESMRRLFGNRVSAAAFLWWGWLSLLLSVGLILSHSRWGAASALAGVVVLVSFYLARQSRRGFAVLVLLLLAGGGFFTSQRIGMDRAAERLRELGPESASVKHRLVVWRSTLSMAGDYPALGTGLGTFRDVFPAYRPAAVPNPYHHAHNDYLNLLSDLGVPGLAAALVLAGAAVARLTTLAKGPDRFGRDVAAGLLGSMAALLVLSAADFNLQIQANAMAASVVLGLAFAAGRWHHEGSVATEPLRPGTLAFAIAAAWALAIPLAVSAHRFHRTARALPYVENALTYQSAATFESRLDSLDEGARSSAIEEARRGFSEALRWTSDDGWAAGELAGLLAASGSAGAVEGAARAVRSQPTNPVHHLRLGSLTYLDGRIGAADRAVANARRFGTSEPDVLRHVGRYEIRRAAQERSTERLDRGLADWRRAASVVPDRDLESILREASELFADPSRRLAVVPGTEEARRIAYRVFRGRGDGRLALAVGRLLPRTDPELALDLARIHLEIGDAAGAVDEWRWGLSLAPDPGGYLESVRRSAASHDVAAIVRFVEAER